MMMFNPELRRNIWLEMTTHRWVGMPLILSTLLFLAYLINGSELNQGVADGARVICLLLTVLWGANMASEAVLSEVREHTWDNQRMSAMPAWSLMWGKLIGSTIYTWYGAFFCLLVYAEASELVLSILLKMLLLIIVSGLLAQALSMLFALMLIKRGDEIVRGQSILFVLLAAIVAWNIGSVATHSTVPMLWYGMSFDPMNFWLCSMIIFLIWTWVGNYRLMRAELQVSNRIWVWLSFVVFAMVYAAGIFDTSRWTEFLEFELGIHLFVGLLVSGALMYLMLFSEAKDPAAYKRLLLLIKDENWSAVPSNLQCWMGALVLVIICDILFFIEMISADFSYHVVILAFILFALRDVCIVLYLNFNVNRKRADMTAMLYLFILYVVLPSIFFTLDMPILASLFLPYYEGSHAWLSVIAALIEGLLAFWLMRQRWQKAFSSF